MLMLGSGEQSILSDTQIVLGIAVQQQSCRVAPGLDSDPRDSVPPGGIDAHYVNPVNCTVTFAVIRIIPSRMENVCS